MGKREDPGARGASSALESLCPAPDREEDVLGHFLGELPVSEHPPGERVHRAAIAIVQSLKGADVQPRDARHKGVVVSMNPLVRH